MNNTAASNFPLSIGIAQIAWVVKDIEATKRFLEETMGIGNFSSIDVIRAKDFESTYYGQLSDAENLTAQAHSAGTFIELVQPISGNSIFQDFLKANPAGGIHHIAYRVPIADLDQKISEFEKKGFSVVSKFNTPIAIIVFFDTRKEIGVFTELMGITKEGETVIQKMEKS